MIYATLFEGEKALSLTMQGHALGDKTVCAAASMLGYTAAQAVALAQRDGLLKKTPSLHLDPGDISVCAAPWEENREEIRHIFYVVECGLRLLAKNYPREITLRFVKG